ncbi:MAG: hypothetical protein Q9195_008615 [Heterodermia aff. obscurata]
MGAAISTARDALKEDDEAAQTKAKQDLDILQKMVDAVLDRYDANLNEKFLNPDGTSKSEVPGIRALRRARFSTAEVSEKPAEGIDSAINSFFGAASGGGDTKSQVLDGFKKTVGSALNAFLGNTSAGQKEETKYFVYMHHNAIVRLDVKLWRWNFEGKGFSDKYMSVLGYVICLSVVDVKVLKTSEFVYLVSEYAGDSSSEVTKYCDEMGKMYAAVRKVKTGQSRTPSDD